MNSQIRIILYIFILFTILVVYMHIVLTPNNPHIKQSAYCKVPIKPKTFLIHTEGCKIPMMDPYDPIITKYLQNGTELKCNVEKDLIYTEKNTIFIDWSVVKHKLPQLHHCTYDVIWRPSDVDKDHNFYKFVNTSEPFDSNITVTEEFVRVQCFNRRNLSIYTNAFSFVHIKPEVERRCAERRKKYYTNKEEELSVLMLGVDSVSRSNMIRYMPKTRAYLLNNMSAIEMIGYNKIADNTFVNIIPMTTGKFVKELPWTNNMRNVPFDKYEFIWNKYSKQGYRTLIAEDAPDIQMFDYFKSGFAKPPTDYFNRPFSLALEQLPNTWNAEHHCVHGRSEADIVLDYLNQFGQTFALLPTFSFTFISRLTHNFLSNTRKADTIYLKFFKDSSNNNALNKTVIIFFSDHGIRFGDFRETCYGRLEERLPFMFFIFPDWVLNKYPNIKKNLKINSQRLTTPFDIHETLLDILNFQPNKRREKINIEERGISLLNVIPSKRTCEDAGIFPHWCTCSQHKVLPNNSKDVIKVATVIVSKMNEKLLKHPECEILNLTKVKNASQLVLSLEKTLSYADNTLVKYGKQVNSFVDYQLTIQVHPGDAIFEATARFNEYKKSVKMLGDISRISMYGKQSHCVNEENLKKMCYCRNNRKSNKI